MRNPTCHSLLSALFTSSWAWISKTPNTTGFKTNQRQSSKTKFDTVTFVLSSLIVTKEKQDVVGAQEMWEGGMDGDGGTERRGKRLRFFSEPPSFTRCSGRCITQKKRLHRLLQLGETICSGCLTPLLIWCSVNNTLAFLAGRKKCCWAAGISIPYSTLMKWQRSSGTLTSVWLMRKSSLLTSGKVNKNHVSRTQIVN